MKDIAIQFENISKQYRLGLVSTRTLSHDLNRWWQTSILKKEDPYLKIGESNDRSKKGESEYVWALKDISFDIAKGEILGIIGKNGAGKSTLLKILSRVTSPTTGIIKAKGRIASLLEVGTGFHPELTGRENIYMNGSIMGMSRSEITRKLDEIVEFAGIARYLDTPVKRYSSGMTVRLGFSIAAHLEPEILVVDEVLAVGDAEFQKKAIGKMQDVSQGEGRTILFVSHNMAAIQLLCTSTIIVENGMIAYNGETIKAINTYYHQSSIDSPSILDRKDRKGNGFLKIKKIKVYSLTENEDFIEPQLGKKILFEFLFNNSPNDFIDSFRLDFRIDSDDGMRIAWLSTTLKSKSTLEGNKIIFSIDKCPFSAGRYFITHYCMVNDIISDWIQNSHGFDVNEGLFYQSSASIPHGQSRIYHDFDIIK